MSKKILTFAQRQIVLNAYDKLGFTDHFKVWVERQFGVVVSEHQLSYWQTLIDIAQRCNLMGNKTLGKGTVRKYATQDELKFLAQHSGYGHLDDLINNVPQASVQTQIPVLVVKSPKKIVDMEFIRDCEKVGLSDKEINLLIEERSKHA